MATIQFKSKVKTLYYVDDSIAYQYINVPVFDRKHCDMNAFRVHKQYGGVANSDIFKNVLARIRKNTTGERVRLDKIPNCINVDTSGFLAVVTLEV